ncbi:T-complex protein 11-domain-containing protein [Exophiala viscosa]|uniref:T-complex protein 11-domain-containing protein n=1 Tax=Exophiala viscosa TaxID=2486360 RepID=A0AAN6ID63_9EURO|nr:T-complex protein 11-domain-containing protein [Exophiala viscosa]KAI1625773.1 T-complex protein 11-domain-containing protein [Exophiala viscosa]
MEPRTSEPQDIEMDFGLHSDADLPEPPPRLAARFYRKSSARRKTSANSSRRSSISSIQSHSSTRSSHGGPHSTHIAQHLRRASIIESRKARLADRAAHAEQVRLRAAAAKAARGVSYSEEKALAAQAAREKMLADITARCEEEVRRAKKVAEEVKEKKAAELARLKDEMAEKFTEAARRKSIYQQGMRRPRLSSLAAVEEKKVAPSVLTEIDRVYAVKVIQRSWRRYHSSKVRTDFRALGLNLARARAISFEELTGLLSIERTTAVTLRLLKQLGVFEDGSDDSTAIRVFLSAYLVLSHPVQAFSHGGNEPQEQELMAKAQALIDCFEAHIMTTIATSPRDGLPASNDALCFSYNDFSVTFHAWKSQDLSVLVDTLIGSFVNLDLILQATKDDHEGRVAQDYLDAVRQEQIKLLARLKRLAGPDQALSKVRLAVRKARKQRAAEQSQKTVEQIPRASTPVNENHSTLNAAPLTPPATPQPYQRERDLKTSAFANNLGQIMTVLPSNREIAHEILINGSFEVNQRPWTDARKDLMNTLRTSMRASMQDGSSDAAATWTHAMAVLIREKLMKLISRRHPLYDRIDGFLDTALINQQCRNGMFSYTYFFETISGMIAQLCSPGRDEIVRAFATDTTSDTIDRLFDLINIIDLMTLDHINFQFRLAAESVLERGHEHEITSFEKDLREGVHVLGRTKQWWSAAKVAVAPNTSAGAIYARALTDLVLRNTHLSYRNLPETLQMDYVRLLKFRARAFHMVATSSVLLTTKIRLRRNRESLWTKDAERLMSLDLLSTDVNRIVSLVESSHMMPESTKEGLSNFVSRVLPAAVDAARNAETAEQDHQDAIHSSSEYTPSEAGDDETGDVFTEQIAGFLLKSLREHVFARLSASGTAERVRTTTGAAEVLARAGMPELLEEVNRLVDGLGRIRAVDLKAHGKWYDQVAAELA